MEPLLAYWNRLHKETRYVVLFLLLAYTFTHILFSGIYTPVAIIHGPEKIGQVSQEFAPLQKFLMDGKPITLENPRQYGAVFFFVMSPILLATSDLFLIENLLLVLAYLSLLVAFYCIAATLAPKQQRLLIITFLAILWFNFSALYYILGVKNVEMWELALLSFALFAFLKRWRFFAGCAIAAATLIKLLPGIFFLYFLIKDRKTFAYGLLSLVGFLLVAQFLFGSAMGLAYLPTVAAKGLGGSSWAASHFENNSLKGMVYKLASWFTPQPTYPQVFSLSAGRQQLASVLSLFLQGGILLLTLAVLWRSRYVTGSQHILAEFGLVSAAMLLLSPVSALEYSTLLLPAFAIGFIHLLFNAGTVIRFSLFTLAYLLLGHFIPFSIFIRFLPLASVRAYFGLSAYTLDEVYKAIGFPFLGFALLFLFYLLLNRSMQKSMPHRDVRRSHNTRKQSEPG